MIATVLMKNQPGSREVGESRIKQSISYIRKHLENKEEKERKAEKAKELKDTSIQP